MKKRSSLYQRISGAADLQDEPAPGQPLIEIVGQCRVLIEQHEGVCQYNTQQIAVRVKFGTVCVCGAYLELTQMTKHQLIISGRIDSIQLLGGN